MNHILIVVPVYNEEKKIENVLIDLQKNLKNQADILLIDDGSKDKSLYFIKKWNMNFLENKENKGYSYTIKKGLKYGYEHNYNYIITFDSDGQHRGIDAVKLINAIEEEVDVIIGSRYLKEINTDKKLNKIGIKLSTKIVKLFLKQYITDMNSGMKCYNRKAINYIIKEDDQYLDLNLIIKLIKSGYKIKEIPISVKKRIYGTSMYHSKTQRIKYVCNICKYSIKNLIVK